MTGFAVATATVTATTRITTNSHAQPVATTGKEKPMEILVSLEQHLRKGSPDAHIAWWHDESQPLDVRREDVDYYRYLELRDDYRPFRVHDFCAGLSTYTAYSVDKQKEQGVQ
jgi:hypothetical protein